MDKCNNMPVKTPFQRYDKRMIRDELLFGKQTFVKYGRVERKDHYINQVRIDKVAIMVAARDKITENRIKWVKINKGMLR
jgi:hypothetical protein